MDRGSGGEGGQHTIMVLGKVKSAYESSGPSVPALNSGFRSIKRLVILLLPLDGMLVHRKVIPQHYDRQYPFIHVGEESWYLGMDIIEGAAASAT